MSRDDELHAPLAFPGDNAPPPQPKRNILDQPRKLKVGMLRDRRSIHVRHPWLPDRILRFGIARLTPSKQGEAIEELQRLVDAAPLNEKALPVGIRESYVKAYFAGMPGTGSLMQRRVWITNAKKHDAEYQKALGAALNENLRLLQHIAALEDRIEGLTRESGQRTRHEKNMQLKTAWKHWAGWASEPERAKAKDTDGMLRCGERRKMIDRAYSVLREIVVGNRCGLAVHYAAVNLQHVEDALQRAKRYGKNAENVKADMPLSEKERKNRADAVRRFFKDVCKPKEEGGLALRGNPATNLQVKRRKGTAPHTIETLDPEAVTRLDKLSLRLKTLAAILGYAGCRLSEAASLTWDRVDWADKVLVVNPNEHKPELKNERSVRTIKPFEDVWAWLQTYQQETGGKGLLFTKVDGTSYFQEGKLVSFQGAFARALEAAGLKTPEPALRLRRWWETEMRKNGHTELIDVIGGHSKDMGLSNYTNRDAVARAAKVGRAKAKKAKPRAVKAT